MAGNYKHGGVHTRLYNIWKCMRQRCSNPKSSRYSVYGAKGIKVCEEWNDFKRFHDWSMNNGYDEKLTLDRINNDLGYCPQNCRWVTYRRQENNKTNNRSNDNKKKIMTHERILNLVANGARKT